MKRLILTIALVLLLATSSHADPFCDGFEAGFIAGYCYRQTIGCLEPIPPLCPLPRIGEDSWQDGYNRGFIAGLNRR